MKKPPLKAWVGKKKMTVLLPEFYFDIPLQLPSNGSYYNIFVPDGNSPVDFLGCKFYVEDKTPISVYSIDEDFPSIPDIIITKVIRMRKPRDRLECLLVDHKIIIREFNPYILKEFLYAII